MNVIDHDLHEVNGQKVSLPIYMLAEIIFRYGRIKRETLREMIRAHREKCGEKPLEHPDSVLNTQIRRLRKALDGTGYTIKNIHGWGYGVIKPKPVQQAA